MDAKTNLKARLPSRHVTAAPSRAVASRQNWFAAGAFKKPLDIAVSKPLSRHVAKDRIQIGSLIENLRFVTSNPDRNFYCFDAAHAGGKAEKISYADA